MSGILGFTHVMRRPYWCSKQWQNFAQILHSNIIKVPKDFSLLFCTPTWPPWRHMKTKNNFLALRTKLHSKEWERVSSRFRWALLSSTASPGSLSFPPTSVKVRMHSKKCEGRPWKRGFLSCHAQIASKLPPFHITARVIRLYGARVRMFILYFQPFFHWNLLALS